ncbi:methyltransferase domain-containing protein [Nonomuraea sp. NPDC046570]|uniref:protein-L-isoaspartate O-methyltransferase family protein n=1 Tax=Nonomuraea sp. NPDC046570 TaxID=3155255 RepID=UPI0033DD20F9
MDTTKTVSAPVRSALGSVDETYYTLSPDGGKLPQTSAPAIIAAMLDLLQLAPGQRVLEIGTGSGYSTALISHLVGDTGHVVSVEVHPDLTRRAERLLHADQRTNAHLINGDGVKGAPAQGPFDRIIAWAAPRSIPAEWTHQAVPGALMVTPLNVTDLAKTILVVRARRGRHATAITVDRLLKAGFVEAHAEVVDQWMVPPYGVDALVHDGGQQPWWLSAAWLRAEDGRTVGEAVLERLIAEGRPVSGPLAEAEDAAGFYAYLLATRPEGLTTAALGDPGWRIGYASPAGAALVGSDDAILAGDGEAWHALTGWADRWRERGRPGFDRLRPELQRGEHGWLVRVALAD